jgi:hypothetical protein
LLLSFSLHEMHTNQSLSPSRCFFIICRMSFSVSVLFLLTASSSYFIISYFMFIISRFISSNYLSKTSICLFLPAAECRYSAYIFCCWVWIRSFSFLSKFTHSLRYYLLAVSYLLVSFFWASFLFMLSFSCSIF